MLKIRNLPNPLLLIIFSLIISIAAIFTVFLYIKNKNLNLQILNSNAAQASLKNQLEQLDRELKDLKSQDQYLKNKELEEEINNILTSFQKAVNSYENLLNLKTKSKNTSKLDALFAEALNLLSKKNYASAQAVLTSLDEQIKKETEKLTNTVAIPNSPINNIPPLSGYSRQTVQTDKGNFLVDIVSASLNSTRVIVDTASDSDCLNNCPTMSLAEYISRNSAFAGINGSYFCPAEYPSCAGKSNSFDTLLMNKNKVYFNSANNVYSTVPAVIFYGNTARFVTQSLEWGRDTSVDAVIANRPLLTLNNSIAFSSTDQSKELSKGNRSFIGTSANTVYIGVVHNATVYETAVVLGAMGIQNSLNLDDGGSVALWYGGYKVGPGRNIPNAILLTKK